MSENVRFNLRGIEHIRRQVGRKIGQGASGPIGAMLKQWGVRYLRFTRARYLRESGGGGSWDDLAESTKKQRRGKKSRRTKSKRARTKTTTRGTGTKFKILQDTRVLYKGLAVGGRGNLLKVSGTYVRAGFAKGRRHGKGKATIRDIAMFHQEGKGDLPKREILVMPDRKTIAGMNQDARRAVQQITRQAKT